MRQRTQSTTGSGSVCVILLVCESVLILEPPDLHLHLHLDLRYSPLPAPLSGYIQCTNNGDISVTYQSGEVTARWSSDPAKLF